jgi:RecA/RadA recombinase
MARKKKVDVVKETTLSVDDGIDKLVKWATKGAQDSSRVFKAANLPNSWRYIDFCDVAKNRPCLPLEWLFGSRGLISGRVLKYEAEEATGKSSSIFMNYGMAQRMTEGGIYACHFETEAAPPPPDFMAQLGCDPRQVIVIRPKTVEDCLDTAEGFIKNIRSSIDPEAKHPIYVSIDSISSLGSVEVELNSDDKGEASLGYHARHFSKWFRDKLDLLEKADAVMIASAQLKANIKTMPGSYGPMQTTIANAPFAYHSTWIVKLNHSKIDEAGRTGEKITYFMKKNKVSAPGKKIQIKLYHDTGWDFTDATTTLLFGADTPFEVGTYGAGGGWYRHEEINEFKNMRAADFLDAFYENENLLARVREALKIRGFGFSFETDYERDNNPTPATVMEEHEDVGEG